MQRTSRQMINLFVFGFILLMSSGCENSFDPRGPYQKQLVVYSVLSSSSDSQFVRIYTTYNPSGVDPAGNTADTYVRKATVTLTDDSATYKLRDTSITRVDKSRYTDDIGAYIAYPCRTRRGKTYTLSVASDQGNVSATVGVPGTGLLIPDNSFILKAPDRYNEDVTVTIRVSPLTRGYVVRLYLDYLVQEGGVWVHRRDEIPNSAVSSSDAIVQYSYPTLTRRTSEVPEPYINVHFPITVYTPFFAKNVGRYGTDGYKIVSATYILTQVEANLYKYFNLANGFQDPFSIRTDQPDYSNIHGGLGIFGAMTVDSAYVKF